MRRFARFAQHNVKNVEQRREQFEVGPERARKTQAPDAITLTEFMTKLTPEQQAWVNDLPDEAKEMLASSLWERGEAHHLRRWAGIKDEMDYVVTLM